MQRGRVLFLEGGFGKAEKKRATDGVVKIGTLQPNLASIALNDVLADGQSQARAS